MYGIKKGVIKKYHLTVQNRRRLELYRELTLPLLKVKIGVSIKIKHLN